MGTAWGGSPPTTWAPARPPGTTLGCDRTDRPGPPHPGQHLQGEGPRIPLPATSGPGRTSWGGECPQPTREEQVGESGSKAKGGGVSK